MLLTEEEAKKKWCPLDTVPESVPYCTASGCMAWRWIKNLGEEVFEDYIIKTGEIASPGVYKKGELGRRTKINVTPKGFCGLAGRVE